MDVRPGSPWAEAECAEPETVARDDDVPDHLDGGHYHEAEVAAGGEPISGAVEMTGECDAALHEVYECEACGCDQVNGVGIIDE